MTVDAEPKGQALVVGAGPAGLAAAITLRRAGRGVVLVDPAEQVGGMAASLDVGGQPVDLGSHRLHPVAEPETQALLSEALGSETIEQRRNGRIRLGDRWLPFPFGLRAALSGLPATTAARLMADQAVAPARRERRDTYAEVVRAGLGPTALSLFHGPMASKLWGRRPETLTGDLARRRVSVRSPSSVVRAVLAANRGGGKRFVYPVGGYGRLSEALARLATDVGVDLRLGTQVRSLTPISDADGCAVLIGPANVAAPIGGAVGEGHPADDSTGEGVTQLNGPVLWAAPIEPLRSLLGPTVTADWPPPVEWRGLVLVYLVVDASRYSRWDAHYVADPDVCFARLSEPANYGPASSGERSHTVLCAEIPDTVGGDWWTAGPDRLTAAVLDGMARSGLETPRVLDTVVHRLPTVYPVLSAGEQQRQDTLAAVDGLPGMVVFGRHGRVVADNVHQVMAMGIAAAKVVGGPGQILDRAGWRAACQAFEHWVVED